MTQTYKSERAIYSKRLVSTTVSAMNMRGLDARSQDAVAVLDEILAERDWWPDSPIFEDADEE